MVAGYTKTQRIVLLIYLNPLILLQDQEPYMITLSAAVKTLISFPPLCSSLFSFKPFFSSLSPLLSSSKLLFPSFSLSFDSLKHNFSKVLSFLPRGLNVAASMHQLIYNYAWDSVIFCDSINDSKILDGSACIKSSLVVLFSPIVESMKFLSEFFDVDVSVSSKFSALFESVNDAYCSKDIHFSWVNVKCDLGLELKSSSDASVNDFGDKNGFFECGIRDMGWGFCSSDSLVHFGLIYPIIRVSSYLFGSNNNYCEATLSFEILDLFNMGKNRFWGLFGNGIIKLRVTTVYRCKEAVKFEGMLMDPILVRECLGESIKDEKENYSNFFVFRVLEILAEEMGESVRRRGSPIWQILLCFLHRKGYWALLSFLDSNGDTHMGILYPFTSYTRKNEFGGDNLSPFVKKMDSDICKSNMSAAIGEDLTWNYFCKVASESNVIKLEEVYFARECNSSKKLKFLKSMDMQRNRKKIATEKKVMELCEAAKRAAVAAMWKEGGAEEAQCLDALDQLKNCSITYQLLVSTQVLLKY
ncbi:LIM domain-containing protein [Citrus sinensis]|nr:LIM domain-containing protein [Citrus sinensis]